LAVAPTGWAAGAAGAANDGVWVTARREGNVLAQPRHCQRVSVGVETFYERQVVGGESKEPCHASPGKTIPPRWNKVSCEPGEKVGRVIGGYGESSVELSIELSGGLMCG
jgi:hypothetical protein